MDQSHWLLMPFLPVFCGLCPHFPSLTVDPPSVASLTSRIGCFGRFWPLLAAFGPFLAAFFELVRDACTGRQPAFLRRTARHRAQHHHEMIIAGRLDHAREAHRLVAILRQGAVRHPAVHLGQVRDSRPESRHAHPFADRSAHMMSPNHLDSLRLGCGPRKRLTFAPIVPITP